MCEDFCLFYDITLYTQATMNSLSVYTIEYSVHSEIKWHLSEFETLHTIYSQLHLQNYYPKQWAIGVKEVKNSHAKCDK